MPDLRAIVTIPYLSGLPEDVTVNVLHFSSASSGAAAADVIRDHVVEMYNVAPPNGPSGNAAMSIAALYSNALSRVANACSVRVYDLADAKPRIPIERKWTLAASASPTAQELPAECAIACSIYAGVNRPRYRGRIYFGPFHVTASQDETTGQRAMVSVVVRESIGGAVKRLISKGANTQNLAVYSRVDGAMRVATAGWVDDAWDTQRRRGPKAATRYSFAAA